MMEIRTYEKDGVRVLDLAGRLDAEQAEYLKDEFRKILLPNSKVVFNLRELTYLDSTGLGAIVFCFKCCDDKSGKLKLANVGDEPRMILDLTCAYRIFDIYDDLDLAIASF